MRARVSKLSGTGECPITLLCELKASTRLIQRHPDWLVCSPGGGRVVRQGLQERGDELNFF